MPVKCTVFAGLEMVYSDSIIYTESIGSSAEASRVQLWGPVMTHCSQAKQYTHTHTLTPAQLPLAYTAVRALLLGSLPSNNSVAACCYQRYFCLYPWLPSASELRLLVYHSSCVIDLLPSASELRLLVYHSSCAIDLLPSLSELRLLVYHSSCVIDLLPSASELRLLVYHSSCVIDLLPSASELRLLVYHSSCVIDLLPSLSELRLLVYHRICALIETDYRPSRDKRVIILVYTLHYVVAASNKKRQITIHIHPRTKNAICNYMLP